MRARLSPLIKWQGDSLSIDSPTGCALLGCRPLLCPEQWAANRCADRAVDKDMAQSLFEVPSDRMPVPVADVLMPAGRVAWSVADRPNGHTFSPSGEFVFHPTHLCIEVLAGDPGDPA